MCSNSFNKEFEDAFYSLFNGEFIPTEPKIAKLQIYLDKLPFCADTFKAAV